MRRVISVLVTCALGIWALSLPGSAQPAPATWKVLIGKDSPDHAIQGQDFYPRTITVNTDDTVTFAKGAILEHTVTFLSGTKPPDLFLPQPDKRILFNPAAAFPQGGKTYDGTGVVGSGVLEGLEKGFTLTFTKPGRYVYQCLLHPGMTGTVIVQAAGSKPPMTQAQYDEASKSQWAASLAAGERLRASTKVSMGTSDKGPLYTATMVGDPEARVSLFRFAPAPLRVKAGTAVRWVQRDPFEIHTITFQGAGEVPQFLNLEMQPKGPPKIYFNPKIVPPFGGRIHSANTYYNSGILFPVAAAGPTEYSLTFTKPGTYTYWCVVHVPEGMTGTIIVQ